VSMWLVLELIGIAWTWLVNVGSPSTPAAPGTSATHDVASKVIAVVRSCSEDGLRSDISYSRRDMNFPCPWTGEVELIVAGDLHRRAVGPQCVLERNLAWLSWKCAYAPLTTTMMILSTSLPIRATTPSEMCAHVRRVGGSALTEFLIQVREHQRAPWVDRVC
jgi:hypothetical protein